MERVGYPKKIIFAQILKTAALFEPLQQYLFNYIPFEGSEVGILR